MKATTFIKNKLDLLFSNFPEVKIRYEFRRNSLSHIIEIIPQSFYENNKDYINVEELIEDEFESLYPSENIIFISEDSLTEIKSTDLSFGYESFIFENKGTNNKDLIFEGYTEEVNNLDYEFYALAA